VNDLSPWPLRGSEAFELESKVVGDRFSIGVWRADPAVLAARGLADAQEPKLVYVLDGSWALGIAAAFSMLQLFDLVRPGFPPLLLVGIDYPTGRVNSRSRDYTMIDSVPKDHPDLGRLYSDPLTRPGGADRFLEFIETELDPLIRSRYSVQGTTAGILGDSFGGTFTFYAFLKQSRLFDRYWLGSPGLVTTGTDHVGQLESMLQGTLVHETRMFLSLGDLEVFGEVDYYRDMGRHYFRVLEALSKSRNPGLTYRARLYPGHTHTTVLGPALNDALLYLYGPHFPG
jgi:predicted alpha/beta superfamily hydrolase